MNHLALTRTANFGNTSLYQKLMIMENILLTVQNEFFLLSTLNEGTLSQLKKISELDIFFTLWCPIINGLINVNKRLRLKSGDTVYRYILKATRCTCNGDPASSKKLKIAGSCAERLNNIMPHTNGEQRKGEVLNNK